MGRYVARYASHAGWPVISLGSADIDLSNANDAQAVRETVQPGDVVINAAAVAPTKSADDFCLNLEMTSNLARELMPMSNLHVVVVSSDAVYGSGSGVINEESPCNPDTLHGTMSLARELLMFELEQATVSVLRPSPIYGYEDTHNSYGPNRMVREAQATGRISIFGEGQATRDHVSVQDVAKMVVEAAKRRTANLVNVASGQSIAFSKLAKMIASFSSNNVTIEHVGNELAPTFRTMDISRLVRSFPGHVPISLDSGMRDLVNDCESANGN